MAFKEEFNKQTYVGKGIIIGIIVGLLMVLVALTPMRGFNFYNKIYSITNYIPISFLDLISHQFSSIRYGSVVAKVVLVFPVFLMYYGLIGYLIGWIIKKSKK